MKNFLLIIVFLLGLGYYFVPYDTKVELLDKVGIDYSIYFEEADLELKKGEVVNLEFDENKKVIFKGNISNGEIMKDLSWSSKGFVKCFTSDKNNLFNGNVVLHRVLLGKKKNISIKLITDPNLNLNIYAYKTNALSKVFPPEIENFYGCKVDFKNSGNKLIEVNGDSITSDIVIGISGAEGLLEGGYTLELEEK